MNGNGGNDISKVYNFISELINFENKEINLEFLSEDFYDELLNVETGINYDFTYENYEKLIQLYLTGISVNMKKNNNEKAKGFAIRAINFLSNSECIKLIKDKKKCEKNENLKISKVIESEKLEIEKKQNNLSKRKIEINLIKNNRIMQSLNNKNNKNLIKSKLNEYYQNIKNGKSLLNKELDKQIKSFEIKKRHKLNKKNNQKKKFIQIQ